MTKPAVTEQLKDRYTSEHVTEQWTIDKIPTVWVLREDLCDCMKFLKTDIERPYKMLYDLTAIDERTRNHREGQPDSDFTLVYHLFSFDRNEYMRIKLALKGEFPSAPSISSIWANANWYEREIWDMFGIQIDGHPNLRRILMPLWWEGHPLRKEHPARAMEMDTFAMVRQDEVERDNQLQFDPEQWGMKQHTEDTDFMFLNIGPQHPGTHGLLRVILQLDDEEIVDAAIDIGYHHRGVEKMGERQTWHTYIPYTDRIDYLGGVMNNLAYVTAVETLAGIDVPDRAKVIRVMMAEFFRIASHLVWYSTFAQDLHLRRHIHPV